jgi:predicted aconitase
MAVRLSVQDRRMLDGGFGEATRMAMSVVSRMAEVEGAAELMDVTQAHIDACGLLSDAGLEFAETLAAKGGRVRIPTTLNMGPLDLQNWRSFGIPEAFAEKAIRQAAAYESMGCVPTWTCTPYQGYLTPRFGQQIAWGESNAIVYANSVLGARTNRYGDFMDICAAITGRVPRCGLHLAENRRGQILLRLVDIAPELWRDGTLYAALGHLMGPQCANRIPVIEGLPATASDDQLKALGAAAASSGAVALFHALGVTPEAPDLDAVFRNGGPEQVVEIREDDLLEACRDLGPAAEGRKIDCVVLGCPHYSFAEFRTLAQCIKAEAGKTIHPNVTFIVTTSQQSCSLLDRRKDLMDILLRFGVRITLDTCVFHSPILQADAKTIMTDSGKCAYYAPGELGVEVAFGSVADCVRSAAAGVVTRSDPPWK